MINKLSRFYWTIIILMINPFNRIKGFKIFCTKIDGNSEDEWKIYEKEINESQALRKFFKLKQGNA